MKMDEENGRKRFFETLAVSAYLFSAFGLPPLVMSLIIYLSIYSTVGLTLIILYFIWIWMDRTTHETGGRRASWFRHSNWWKYHRSYFPVQLHKTVELPPDKNYLLSVFPHGVLSAGPYSAFGTDANDFKKLFPGLISYLCTLKFMFFQPVLRELMIWSGLISPSEKSIDWVLGSPGVGRACVLVVGGAAESEHNQHGVYKTILRHRKGFCRIALRNGCGLVPVVVFGEVDAYQVNKAKPGSCHDYFQKFVKNITGILPIRFIGDGFMGLLPKRVPIDVVVGEPIHVEQKTEISKQDINELHEKFTASIIKLFDAEKRKYLKNVNTQLEFV